MNASDDLVQFHTVCGCTTCNCTMANKLVPNPKKYGPYKIKTSSNTTIDIKNLSSVKPT